MRLLLRALRWRAAAAVATALLAAVTVLGAVVGPLWVRAAGESILRDTLTAITPDQNAALGEAHGVPTQAALRTLDAEVAKAPLSHHRPAVHGLKLLSDLAIPGGTLRLRSPLLWREAFCG